MLKYQIDIVVMSIIRCLDTLGLTKQSIGPIIGRPLLLLFNSFLFLLDNVFYPQYKKVHLKKPVFITGHPRSGTTFLHRLIGQTNEFVCFEFWHTSFTSLVARKILSPVERLLRNKNKNILLDGDSGHHISFNSIEEEEFILFTAYNSPMTTLFSPFAFTHEDLWDMFYFEKQPPRLKTAFLQYIEGCYKRQVYYLGRNQILSKMPYAMLRLKSFMQTFPDAKFVYIIRSPYEVVPSFLSLTRAILDNFWGLDNLPSLLLNSIYQRVYQQSLRYYDWVEDLENQGVLNPEQVMTLPYNLLITDLQKAVDSFLEFTEIDISEELRNMIRIQAGKQKSYHGRHQNLGLESFGFSTERLKKDFDFVIDKYGFDNQVSANTINTNDDIL